MIPKIIYLQIGEDIPAKEFDECDKEAITWCADRIFKSDIPYILKSEYNKLKAEHRKVEKQKDWNPETLLYMEALGDNPKDFPYKPNQ